MSAVIYANNLVPDICPKAMAIEICEGDWKTYLRHISKRHDNKVFMGRDGDVMVYKRQCAMAYLGKRAQIHGGVYSRTLPRTLTAQFNADLEARNRAQRYQRYPWLEKLQNLLAEIERIQDEGLGSDVISLVSLYHCRTAQKIPLC